MVMAKGAQQNMKQDILVKSTFCRKNLKKIKKSTKKHGRLTVYQTD